MVTVPYRLTGTMTYTVLTEDNKVSKSIKMPCQYCVKTTHHWVPWDNVFPVKVMAVMKLTAQIPTWKDQYQHDSVYAIHEHCILNMKEHSVLRLALECMGFHMCE